jgi:hypothetical protein
MRINSQKFPHCQVGVVVRIRSVSLKEELDGKPEEPWQKVVANPHTNILLIPGYTKQALMIAERVIDEQVLRDLLDVEVN